MDKSLTPYPYPCTLKDRLLIIENHMEQVVRMVSWVTKAQKAKVRAKAKAARKADPKASDSSIIRGLINKLK